MRIAIVFDRSAFLLIKTNLLRDSSARAFITTSFLHPYALEYVQNTLFRDVVWITLYPNYNTVYGLFTWPLNSYLLSYYSSMGIPVNKVWVVMCLLSTWPLYISRKDSRNFHYNSNRQVLLTCCCVKNIEIGTYPCSLLQHESDCGLRWCNNTKLNNFVEPFRRVAW